MFYPWAFSGIKTAYFSVYLATENNIRNKTDIYVYFFLNSQIDRITSLLDISVFAALSYKKTAISYIELN